MFSPVCVRTSAGSLANNDQIFQRNFAERFDNPEINRLDFGGNPDLDTDPGII